MLFVKNILILYSRIRGKSHIPYKGSRLILIEENLSPHSFLNWIFINRTAYEEGKIENEILWHEWTHIRQRHTIDLLILELITAFCWFNPFVFLYKRAIRLNHEFLADEGAIREFQDIPAYQHLLVDKTNQQPALAVSSQFIFLITKKRLVMITRHSSRRIAILKQAMVILVLVTVVFAFSSESTQAQETENTIQSQKKQTPKSKDTSRISQWTKYFEGGTQEGVSDNLLAEYQGIINRNKTEDMSWHDFRKNIPASDSKRREEIFMQMNLLQQKNQTVIFMKPIGPLPRVVPTQKQLENFKNPKNYGVWIDGKKVSNSALKKYVPKDFAQVYISKLLPGAKNARSYSYQVDLMTKDYYEAYYDRTMADRSNKMRLLFRRPVKK